MPPEPTPWGGDRKEFLRDRRHGLDRANESSSSASLGPQHHPPPAAAGGGRWRDSYGSRGDFGGGGRWAVGGGGGGPEFRRPPGHGKQGGWQAYHEEPGYGFSAPRSGNRFPENDGFRPFGARGDGRYARGYRDNRAFGQREWRGTSWDNNRHEYGTVASLSVRPHEVNGHSYSNDAFKRASPRPNSLNSSDQFHHPSQTGKRIDENGSGVGRRTEKENSMDMDWRPLKWSRSGNLTSRGSNFNISSSTASIDDAASWSRTELLTLKSSPVEHYLGDPSASTTSAAPTEENASRKKPRLGWGEGLAKYEKKKVDGPDEDANRTIETVGSNGIELSCSVSSGQADKNPSIPESANCRSPTTESSIPCGSSPVMEEKPLSMLAISNIDSGRVSGAPLTDTSVQKDVSVFNIDDFEPGSTSNFSSLLIELLHSEDQSLVYSGLVKPSPRDKLLLWKEEITKVLELTESEIDSLENELKSFRPIPDKECSSLSLPSTISIDIKEELQKAPTVIPTSATQEVALSGEHSEEIPRTTDEGTNSEIEGGELGSLCTATSKYVKPLCIEKIPSLDEQTKINPTDLDVNSPDLMQNPLVSSPNIESLAALSDIGSSNVVQENVILNCGENCPAAGEDDVRNEILACNRVMAAEASELFLKSLRIRDFHFNHVNQTTISCGESKLLQKKFLQRKRFLKFKEKVIYVKYRAFQRLWKEDLRFLSERKHRAKSQKKSDPGLRILHNGHQKHRSSVRSRNAYPAATLSLVPATEVISFTSKLLSDCKMKIYRDGLKMPALILDEKEKAASRFISNNGLVEDPCAVEKGRALINPWTADETEIFIDKLANFGKDFRKIASFLDYKTAADCVEFYYKNHKSESFERTKKKPELKKLEKSLSANTYLVTTGSKWSRGLDSVSLDLLGEASAFAAHEDECLEAIKVGAAGYCGKSRVSRNLARSRTYDVEDERETAAADVLAGICGSLSSEAVSSCITTSADPGEISPELKRQRFSSSSRRPLTPEASQDVDDETCSEESCGRMDPVDWTDEEKSIFVQSFSTYGKDFALISRRVQTKSRDQCKVFFSKARKCLGLDMICPDPSNGRTPVSDDVNGSGSDSDGACAIEAHSDLSTDKSGSGLDEDLVVSTSDQKHKEAGNEAVDVLGQMKLMEHRDSGQPENLNLDVQKADNSFLTHLAAEVITKVEIEQCMTKNNQDNADAADLCTVKEETALEDSAMADEVVDAAPELLGVTGSSMSGDSKVVDEACGGHPSVSEHASNVHEIPSALYEAKISEEDAIKRPANTDAYHPASLQALVGHDVSSQILKGYPLAFPIEGEANASATRKQCPPEPSTRSNVRPLRVFSLRKCSSVESKNSATELNFQYERNTVSKNSEGQLPIPSASNKPHSTGDVKLFGKILSKPSSAAKQTLYVTENKENGVCQPSPAGLFEIKGSVDCNSNGKLAVPKSDNIMLEVSGGELPMRSYGFWDGTKLQTGYSTLPDSAMLLAKYPAAFRNLPLGSPNMEQQQLLPNFNTSGCLLNGASVLPTMELPGSNGVTKEYQLKKGHDVLQPFRLELLHRPDLLNVAKSGFDEVPGYQPNDSRVGKLNVVQVDDQGGNGVSDPVAALKLHFAKAQAAMAAAASSNSNGNGVVGMEESWRGQPGVGR